MIPDHINKLLKEQGYYNLTKEQRIKVNSAALTNLSKIPHVSYEAGRKALRELRGDSVNEHFQGMLLEDCDWNINDLIYKKGQIVDLVELDEFKGYYGHYDNKDGYNILDWIPKKLVKVIE